ncbi:EG45-like domain containing protein [Papaver somniferum]|uniref:EG45-like domain containing protein n=1 Tax=Papaver somniferum TaxID=3469 RepID=UPI000E704F63|nr:EG45-like domain containing protein [Papaver somniferum]
MASSPFFISLALVLISFCSLVTSKSSGTATFYTDYIPSACNGNKNEGVMIAAASDAFWDDGAACGSFYKVSCVGGHPCTGSGSVTVKIVDYCPRCQGTIDLSQEAFAKIADTNAGVIKITYQRV